MILDERLEFADADVLTTGTGNNLEGDVVDLGIARDIGNGQELMWFVDITTTVTSAGGATVNFQLISDDNAALSSPVVHLETGAIAVANLTEGTRFQYALPVNGGPNEYQRYLGIRAVVGTAALTAGAINSYITLDKAGSRSYADAVN